MLARRWRISFSEAVPLTLPAACDIRSWRVGWTGCSAAYAAAASLPSTPLRGARASLASDVRLKGACCVLLRHHAPVLFAFLRPAVLATRLYAVSSPASEARQALLLLAQRRGRRSGEGRIYARGASLLPFYSLPAVLHLVLLYTGRGRGAGAGTLLPWQDVRDAAGMAAVLASLAALSTNAVLSGHGGMLCQPAGPARAATAPAWLYLFAVERQDAVSALARGGAGALFCCAALLHALQRIFCKHHLPHSSFGLLYAFLPASCGVWLFGAAA